MGSSPHMELELGDKGKDQVESSPGAAMITSADKVCTRVYDDNIVSV